MLRPKRIYGVWDYGIVLDNHMQKSVFIGYDDNGKEKFENTRTEIGELLYRFKYKNDKKCLAEIVGMIKEILDKWNIKQKIDIIISVPPSNKSRKYQPVNEIAREIARYLNKKYIEDILIKNSKLQAKDKNKIKGLIKQIKEITISSNVLIIDDLYSTGATLNEVCRVLRKDKNVKNIYCLVITKTKG